MFGEDQQNLAVDTKIEVKKFRKRLVDRNNLQPPRKKSKPDAVETGIEEEKEVSSDTIDNAETSQKTFDEASTKSVPNDKRNLQFFHFPPLKSIRKKPSSSKRISKPNFKSKGQTKISSFFTNTKQEKRFSADSPSPAPT